MRIRTFIAVTASPGIRQAALKLVGLLGPVAGDVKWVAPENLHWTLQFLGDLQNADVGVSLRDGPETSAALTRPSGRLCSSHERNYTRYNNYRQQDNIQRASGC